MSIVALLLAIAKAVPPLAGLCQRLIDVLQQWDTKKNEAEAAERLDRKNADVFAGIHAARERVRARQAEQQRKADDAP